MNIGYVKIRKKKTNDYKKKLGTFFKNIKQDCKSLLNIVEQDKYNDNIFYLNNLNSKSKAKLIKKLIDAKMDCALVEGNNKIEYPVIDGTYTMKAMIPEMVDYCYKAIKPEIDEIYICTETFNFENVSIIEDLTKKVKVVNVVTSHRRFRNLEKRLEERDIFITVSGNKRQSLKKAQIVINLDFTDLNLYNINRNMVVIDVTGKIELPKSFNGVVIRKVTVDTKKIMRVFSDFENFSKQDLISAKFAIINDYRKARDYIFNGKIYINKLYNYKEILPQDFLRLQSKNKPAKKK